MSRRDFVLAIVIALGLGLAGCTSMEQYHYMPAYTDVPVKVKLAFSEKYPNDVIKTDGTVQEKMFDGSVRYRLTATDSKNVVHERLFSEDGQELQ